MSTLVATVIAGHGRNYVVEANGQRLHCVTRSKKSDIAVGDHVVVRIISPAQAVIESIVPRKTLLYRSDQYKSKLLAANVTQLFIVVATEPSFSDDFVSRALIAAEAADVPVHLILNKTDLVDLLPHTQDRLKLYADLGYPVHAISVIGAADACRQSLLPLLRGQTSLVIGQSGMGKSTLINLLVPDADIATREISTALHTGKHTTTFTHLYAIDADSAVIDSPGFQEFGLYHLTEGGLERAFREFAPFLGHCRFYNCRHLVEPGCAILQAVQSGEIHPMRHALYAQLVHESGQKLY